MPYIVLATRISCFTVSVLKRLFGAVALGGLVIAATASAAEPVEKKPMTIVIFVDGFRPDRVNPEWTPRLAQLAASGVSGPMLPIWPALSIPNHWALATGLNVKRSGVWHNEQLNPVTQQPYDWRSADFAHGEPIWATAKRYGKLTAVVGSWWGSQTTKEPPSYAIPSYEPAPGAPDGRTALALALLDQPEAYRPDFLAVYFIEVDHSQHRDGVDSAEARAATAHVDRQIGQIVDGLASRGLKDRTNIVLVADHGHANSDGVIVLADVMNFDDLIVRPLGGGPIFAVWPKEGRVEAVYNKLKAADPRIRVYRREEIPAEFECCREDQTPPILLVAADHWNLLATRDEAVMKAKGSHAYRLDNPMMRAAFVAVGPAFRSGATLPLFKNINVYSLLAHLQNVPANHTDGSIAPFCSVLVRKPAECDR
jgi:predicted AlkP superfamily pyrophosphatase or phosphodiesterase